jgi:Mg2+ and Co2+ transporter CorA
VEGHLLLTNCVEDEVTRPAIEQALNEGTLLWLDLADAGPDTIALLATCSRSTRWPSRTPRSSTSGPRSRTTTISSTWSPTARAAWTSRWSRCTASTPSTSWSPCTAKPTDQELAALFGLKRQLVDMRKLVTPQRDMMASMLSRAVAIPGMTDETERYMRDLYDHLIRISDMVDSYRDLLSGSLDAYMSVVSNRLNDMMRQLTIIATVFLPLSFLTGFFGQNFGWMVTRLGSLGVFLGLGLGTEIVGAVGLLILFRRRGWM